jgi:hypothetical protein
MCQLKTAVSWEAERRCLANTAVSEVFTSSTIKASGQDTSETSVNTYQAIWRNVPEESHIHIHTRRR